MKLILTHGGMLTIQEAIWHEKPILGIPIQYEQHRNIQRAIELGFAESINANNFTSIELIVKIHMLIENSIYVENVRKVSKLMRSISVMKPKDIAIYWIEQVIEHKGLSHLKCEARKLSFFQLYMIDILSIIGIVILAYILIMQYHLIKEWILRKERRRIAKEKEEEEKLKNEIEKLKNE